MVTPGDIYFGGALKHPINRNLSRIYQDSIRGMILNPLVKNTNDYETELTSVDSASPSPRALRHDVEELSEFDIEEGEHRILIPFSYSHGITSEEALRLLEIHGRNELPEKVIPKWYIFVSQLWQPMPIMIWIAAIVEAGIQNWVDMAILLFIQFANASISYYEITKAGDAVAALKSSLQAKATVKRDGIWRTVDIAEVVPGDLVLLAAGSAVPADCRVNEGQIEVDQAALTGESLPVLMVAGDSCKMGSTVARGEQEGTVEFTGANTFFGKTAALLTVCF